MSLNEPALWRHDYASSQSSSTVSSFRHSEIQPGSWAQLLQATLHLSISLQLLQPARITQWLRSAKWSRASVCSSRVGQHSLHPPSPYTDDYSYPDRRDSQPLTQSPDQNIPESKTPLAPPAQPASTARTTVATQTEPPAGETRSLSVASPFTYCLQPKLLQLPQPPNPWPPAMPKVSSFPNPFPSSTG